MVARMSGASSKAKFNRRSWVAETPFAYVKGTLGLRQFRHAGLEKVEQEWRRACLSLNVKKILKTLAKRRALAKLRALAKRLALATAALEEARIEALPASRAGGNIGNFRPPASQLKNGNRIAAKRFKNRADRIQSTGRPRPPPGKTGPPDRHDFEMVAINRQCPRRVGNTSTVSKQ
jgi:hypothetical protein